MSSFDTSRVDKALKAAAEKRMARLAEIEADPFMGYANLDDALEEYKLNTQAEVLARLLNRENLFISGPAGSGKTTIINRFKDIIDAQFFGKFDIALTASTGIAATLIGGTTIHSWAGLGIDTKPFNAKELTPQLFARRSQMRTTDVLVIDEISMLPAYLFTKLDAVLKWARQNTKPFGGIQLVLLGDFLQLPPVSRRDDESDTSFSITTAAWKHSNIRYCYMDKTHRSVDMKLKYLLAAVASGDARSIPKAKQLIDSRKGTRQLCDPSKTYTTLFTTNQNVDKYNEAELAKNTNIPIKSRAKILNGSSKDVADLMKQYGIPEEFVYKVGATVMVTSNITNIRGELLANGSIGVVESNTAGIPRVRFNDGTSSFVEQRTYTRTKKMSIGLDPTTKKEVFEEVPIAQVTQLPLRLGYAITVHRSQGQTLDGVVCDLSKIFTSGLGYVALSRVRQLDDLVIVGWNDRAFDVDKFSQKVARFVKKNAKKTRDEFVAKRKEYEGLLDDALVRYVIWDENESAKMKGGSRGAVISTISEPNCSICGLMLPLNGVCNNCS